MNVSLFVAAVNHLVSMETDATGRKLLALAEAATASISHKKAVCSDVGGVDAISLKATPNHYVYSIDNALIIFTLSGFIYRRIHK